jgi:hypothetical protein
MNIAQLTGFQARISNRTFVPSVSTSSPGAVPIGRRGQPDQVSPAALIKPAASTAESVRALNLRVSSQLYPALSPSKRAAMLAASVVIATMVFGFVILCFVSGVAPITA